MTKIGMTRGRWVAVVVVGALSFAVNLHQTPWTGFNPDESRWISRAHFLRDLADPFGPTWEDRYTTRGQPPVGSYATGLGLVVQGRDLDTNLPWEFSYAGGPGWQRNIAEGRMPVAEDLAAARRASAAYAAAAAAVVTALAWSLVGPVGGWAAGVVFAVHPFSAYVGSIATADAVFGLLIALAALAAAGFGGRPRWSAAVALGVALGLGGGAKLSPLLVGGGLGVIGGGLLVADCLRRRTVPRDRFAWLLVAVSAATAMAFVACYPYLWPDPVGRTRNLVEFRAEEMQAQATDWPVMAVPTRVEALRRVGVNFGERYGLTTRAALAIETTTGRRLTLPSLEIAAALVGALLWSRRSLRCGWRDSATLALLVLCGVVAVTVAGMRSEFDRYHVPMAVFGAVAIGFAATAMASVWRTVNQKKTAYGIGRKIAGSLPPV
jgi:hypothetical protein